MPGPRRRTTAPSAGVQPPDLADLLDDAPAALQSGAVWDGVAADAGVHVPAEVFDVELSETVWTRGDLVGRRFAGLRCRDVRFERCDLSGAILDGAVLTRVEFRDCRLAGIVLSGSALTDVRIVDSRADSANLRMAVAHRLLVENTALTSVELYRSRLTDTALLDCDLTHANVAEAQLSDVELHGSTLDGIRGASSLGGAAIDGAQLVALAPTLAAEIGIRVTERSR